MNFCTVISKIFNLPITCNTHAFICKYTLCFAFMPKKEQTALHPTNYNTCILVHLHPTTLYPCTPPHTSIQKKYAYTCTSTILSCAKTHLKLRGSVLQQILPARHILRVASVELDHIFDSSISDFINLQRIAADIP